MAQDKWKMYQICPVCNGTGQVTKSVSVPGQNSPNVEVITCPRCSGEKYVEWGYVHAINP